MNYNLDEMKKMLNDFVHQKVSKVEIGEWAEEAYKDLLKGGFLEIDKLMCYPFIKVISTIHIEEDDVKGVYPCEMSEILDIRDVLNGITSKSFSIKVGIPWKLSSMNKSLDMSKRKIYENVVEILSRNKDKEKLDDKDINILRQVLTLKQEKENTIQYVIDSMIKTCIMKSIDWDDNSVDIKQGLCLYAGEKSNSKDMQENVLKYLEFYIGKRNIGVEILFDKGRQDLFFSI